MRIELYTPDLKTEWDNFVCHSKNGTFLLFRNFIEYHKDRFNDYSLMFYSENTLVALMPGHISEGVFYTHKGLTYGGLIMSKDTYAIDVLTIFEHLVVTFHQQGIKQIVYKAIPHIYHQSPAEEDLYALFRNDAKLTERNISSTILLSQRANYSDSRRNGLKKAVKNNLSVSASGNLDIFWQILADNLKERYNKPPVHSLEEIVYLKKQFPKEIQLFSVSDSDNVMHGGCLVFITDNVVHAQYTAATEEGKKKGAIDLVINHIIEEAINLRKVYFDYGTSTEEGGFYLNQYLIYQKEGFGARATMYDIYTIDLYNK